MQKTAYWYRSAYARRRTLNQTLLVMKLTILLLTAALLNVSATGLSQNITLSGKNLTLRSVFTAIERQTNYTVFFNEDDLQGTKPLSLKIEKMPLADFLRLAEKDQPVHFAIEGNMIVLSRKKSIETESAPDKLPPPPVTGIIRNAAGEPVPGVNVTLKGGKIGTTTDSAGKFSLNVEAGATLVISSVGYGRKEIKVPAGKVVKITLEVSNSPLDEVQIIAYGTSSRRLTTGSVTSVKAKDIEEQPVSNVLQTLAGKVPGMTVAQTDGLPGGFFDIVIRGKNSLSQGYRPLILIDGIPFFNDKTSGSFPGANLSNSPLNVLNPADIESIDVLKDADATAIYGSRGSNGVILITTKKGISGKSRLNLNAYTGINKSTKNVQLMNTPQYLEMRREAFKNDGIQPTAANAPDLLTWDTTKNTNWNQLYREGDGASTNLQLDYSGGTEYTNFRIGANYRYETPLNSSVARKVTGKQARYHKDGVQLNVSHMSLDKKLKMTFSAGYDMDKSDFTGLVGFITLPPDAPNPLDSNGKLVWQAGSVSITNPLADLYKTYASTNKILTSSAAISYRIFKGLDFKVNGGYNSIDYNEINSTPKIALNPLYSPTSSSYFQDSYVSGWQVEPILTYNTPLAKGRLGKLEILAGESWSSKRSDRLSSNFINYSSDIYIGTRTGAATTNSNPALTVYNYQGAYGRINYNFENKYILNLTGRRDGSSRFGPGRRYSNFGAAGAAYIFTEEKLIKNTLPFLSFGKLRGNYGVTGNDNIGDYMYYNSWETSDSYHYDTQANGLLPLRLFNSDYSWEKNVKLEMALDLGFFDDRLLLTANYYNSRSGNQLVSYRLPSQTGFTSITKNFDAVVENWGWEFTINAKPLAHSRFHWNIDFNLTTARNKLASFPGLATSSYANTYIIGKPITGKRLYPFTGVDPKTGLYTYKGTTQQDRTVMSDYNTPHYYGGITNNFEYKGFSLDIFLQFVRQDQPEYINRLTGAQAGTMINQPVEMLDRWQKQGDHAKYQQYTTGKNPTISAAFYPLTSSTAYATDASFIRLKNLSFGYTFREAWLKKASLSSLRIYFQGQNLAVLTPYKGADPESGGLGNPLIKTYTGGIQVTF